MVAEYALAGSPEEAMRLLADDPEAIVLAGGTTLMPRVTLGELNGRRVIGLARAGLDEVRRNGATTIGATVPLRELAGLDELPALAGAARRVGGRALRTTATVGGNVLAPHPYGDLTPVLLALDAELAIAGEAAERRVPLADALAAGAPVGAGELLTAIAVPPVDGAVSFERCARRDDAAPPIVTVAARIRREGEAIAEARLGIGAAGPRPVRATEAEAALVGSSGDEGAVAAAVGAARAAVAPVDDSVASAWYRGRMLELHVRRAIEGALAG